LSYRWARILAHALGEAGLREVVVIPGSRSTPLIAAFQDAGLRLLPVHDERVGGFLALGLARALRRPVGVVTTSGSAGGHLLPAAMEAHASGIPLLLLTTDRPPHLVGSGASQTTDQSRLLEGFVKAHLLFPPPGSMPPGALVRMALQAWETATSGRPGPVHLNLPFAKPLEPTDLPVDLPPVPRVSRPPQDAVLPVSMDLAGLLSPYTRVLAVVGEDLPPLARRWVQELSRTVPVLASPLSGVEGIRTYGLIARHPVREDLTPEAVIQIGALPLDRAFLAWTETWPVKDWIQIALDGHWKDPFHLTTHWVPEGLPDPPETLPTEGFRNRWVQANQALSRWLESRLQGEDGVWSGLFRLLRVLPSGAWLHIGASLPVRDLEMVAGAVHRLPRVWMNRGLNGIDGLVSTAAGEALATGPGVLWIGDMAFLHDLGGVVALNRLRPPLLVVVVNNRGGRIFEELPIAEHPDILVPYLITPHELDLAAIAESLDLPARWVERAEDLLVAVQDLWKDLPAVVEFRVDPQEERKRREKILEDLKTLPLSMGRI